MSPPVTWRTRAYSPDVLHVLKRWAAWPQGTRWLAGGIAAVVVALAIAWVLFVPGADWLARMMSAQPRDRYTRQHWITLGVGC